MSALAHLAHRDVRAFHKRRPTLPADFSLIAPLNQNEKKKLLEISWGLLYRLPAEPRVRMAPTAAEQSQQHTRKAVGLAARDASGHLAPLAITRRYAGRASSSLCSRETMSPRRRGPDTAAVAAPCPVRSAWRSLVSPNGPMPCPFVQYVLYVACMVPWNTLFPLNLSLSRR